EPASARAVAPTARSARAAAVRARASHRTSPDRRVSVIAFRRSARASFTDWMVEPRRPPGEVSEVNGPVNSRDWRDSVDRKWPYSRASAQVPLVAVLYAAAGVTIGVHLHGDEVALVYEVATRPVRGPSVEPLRVVV